VTFFDGTRTLSAQPADQNGRAVFDTALLAAGTHTLSAMYHGLSISTKVFPPSTSSPVTVTVNSTNTATTATVSAGSVTAGAVATLGASVTSASGTPFGGVTFFDGTVPLGTAALNANGSASFSVASLSVGTHSISASFNANATFAASSSVPVMLVVQPAAASSIPTFTALSATLHPESGTVAFHVTVVADHGSPQSTVIFLDGGEILGRANTDSTGVAVLNIPLPANGPHSFRGSFSGDSQFEPSVSPVIQELWSGTGPGFSVAANPAVVRFDGVSGETQITIVAATASQAPVHLACGAGLPDGLSCGFEPASLPQGGASRLSIHRSAAASKPRHSLDFLARGVVVGAMVMFGVVIFPRKRVLGLLMLLCVGLWVFSGCGGSPVQTRNQVQVVTIQATSGAGQSQTVHSAQIILTTSSPRM
jgi:hypothetical protein